MKLTVLSENAVLYPGLEGEFGLSVYPVSYTHLKPLYGPPERRAPDSDACGAAKRLYQAPAPGPLLKSYSLLLFSRGVPIVQLV